ncbi:hypothetical protein L1887_58899 [Cichorium endivia]|nr:hypothetical protein L1887_58899 [Cichorium endivia]
MCGSTAWLHGFQSEDCGEPEIDRERSAQLNRELISEETGKSPAAASRKRPPSQWSGCQSNRCVPSPSHHHVGRSCFASQLVEDVLGPARGAAGSTWWVPRTPSGSAAARKDVGRADLPDPRPYDCNPGGLLREGASSPSAPAA